MDDTFCLLFLGTGKFLKGYVPRQYHHSVLGLEELIEYVDVTEYSNKEVHAL